MTGRDIESLVRIHLASQKFMDIIVNGMQWSVYEFPGDGIPDNGYGPQESHLRIWGETDVFKSAYAVVDLVDITCGTMDYMGIKYALRYFEKTKSGMRAYYEIARIEDEDC